MKIRTTWQFWAILAFGYLLNGWKGVLAMLWLMSALILLNLTVWVFTSSFRNYLISHKGYRSDGKFIQLCCKRGLHTWGEVTEDIPQSETGKHYQKTYRLKFGERKSLCCGKMQVVDSFVDGNHWGRLDEKYYRLRDDCRQ